MKDLKFGPAHKRELPLILQMAQITYGEHSERLPEIFQGNGAHSTAVRTHKKSFRRFKFLPVRWSNTLIAARLSGELVGYIAVKHGDFAWIENIFVTPEHRKQGSASGLLNHAKTTSKRAGASGLFATVWHGNAP